MASTAEFKQTGKNAYILHTKATLPIRSEVIKFKSVDSARELATSEHAIASKTKKISIGLAIAGLLLPAASLLLSSHQLDIHGFNTPFYNQPEWTTRGEIFGGTAAELLAYAGKSVSDKVNTDANKVNAAIDTFLQESQNNPATK